MVDIFFCLNLFVVQVSKGQLMCLVCRIGLFILILEVKGWFNEFLEGGLKVVVIFLKGWSVNVQKNWLLQLLCGQIFIFLLKAICLILLLFRSINVLKFWLVKCQYMVVSRMVIYKLVKIQQEFFFWLCIFWVKIGLVGKILRNVYKYYQFLLFLQAVEKIVKLYFYLGVIFIYIFFM